MGPAIRVQHLLFMSMASEYSNVTRHSIDKITVVFSVWGVKQIYQPLACFTSIWQVAGANFEPCLVYLLIVFDCFSTISAYMAITSLQLVIYLRLSKNNI